MVRLPRGEEEEEEVEGLQVANVYGFHMNRG